MFFIIVITKAGSFLAPLIRLNVFSARCFNKTLS